MPGELSLILEIIAGLLPLLKKDEWAQLKKEIEKLEKEWEEDEQLRIKALEEGDLMALNRLLAKLKQRVP